MAMNNRRMLMIDRESGCLEIKEKESVKQFYIGVKEASALSLLLSSHGWRCSKNVLKESLWPEKEYVDDNLVAAIISSVRKSLNETNLTFSIKAITKYGYKVSCTDDIVIEFIG